MLTIAHIQARVARQFGVSVDDLRGPRRVRTISRPRHAAMLLAREMTQYGWTRIGRRFGDRDHCTVIKGVRSVQRAMQTDDLLRARVNLLRRDLGMDAELQP